MTDVYDLKTYYNNGRLLEWGASLSAETLEAMKKGEIFTILRPEGVLSSKVFMDFYNQIQKEIIS